MTLEEIAAEILSDLKWRIAFIQEEREKYDPICSRLCIIALPSYRVNTIIDKRVCRSVKESQIKGSEVATEQSIHRRVLFVIRNNRREENCINF
jgi:hypothetical protein